MGAGYTIAEHVLDLSALVDMIGGSPVYLIGHSLGGMIVIHDASLYPDQVKKVVTIEGVGFPANHRVHGPASARRWIEDIRKTEGRDVRSYPYLESAVARMKEANPHLSDEVARHLTLHGTNGTPTVRWAGNSTRRRPGRREDDHAHRSRRGY